MSPTYESPDGNEPAPTCGLCGKRAVWLGGDWLCPDCGVPVP